MSPRTRNAVLVLVGLSISLLTARYLFTPVEQFRLQSPDGDYTAVVSSYRIWQLLPRMPGQPGDRPVLVNIVDQTGRSLGSMPVPMLSMARELEWIAHGARIKAVGSWNFRDGFYAYWNEAQTHMIVENIN
jgi:hypothetical protein